MKDSTFWTEKILSQTDLFDQFWNDKVKTKKNAERSHGNLFNETQFQYFIAFLFGFSPNKYAFVAQNIMAIRSMIASHLSVTPLRSERSEAKAVEGCTIQKTVVITLNKRKMDIHLNGHQWDVFEKFPEKNGTIILLGPPGSGKTLMIMLLANYAAAQNKGGRVLVLVPSNSLAKLYETFFDENKCSHRRREIVINPSEYEIHNAEFDDVFADEVFTGSWLPADREKNCRTVMGLTVGRYYDRESMKNVVAVLSKSYSLKDTNFIHLKSVMRNTNNIFAHYNEEIYNSSVKTNSMTSSCFSRSSSTETETKPIITGTTSEPFQQYF